MEKPIKHYTEVYSATNKAGRIVTGYALSDSAEADISKVRSHIRDISEIHSGGSILRIYKPSSSKATYFVFEGNVENPLSPIQETFPIAIVNYGLSAKAHHISGQFDSMLRKSALRKTLDTLMGF